MEKTQKLTKKETILQIVKFTLFSISAGVIQFGSFALLHELLHMVEWLAHLISLVLSVVWNFTFNRKFTFKSANNIPLAMLKVAVFYVIFTPLSTYCIDLLVGVGVDGLVAELILMVANFILEFLYSKFFVFNPKLDIKKPEVKKRRVFLIKRKG